MWRDYYWERKKMSVGIWRMHDEKMGMVWFYDLDRSENEKPYWLFSPNMPKLHYALNFSIDEDEIILGEPLYPNVTAHVFQKEDGFNLLAYPFPLTIPDDRPWEIIYKTRKLPEAGSIIRENIVMHKLFPRKQIELMVRDGFIPIMEVYGPILEDFGVGHGPVNTRKLWKMGKINYLNVALLAVRENREGYPFVPVEKMMKLAEEYDIHHAKYYGTVKITRQNLLVLMSFAEQRNKDAGFTVLEGFVLHTMIDGKYIMLKVKPYEIMKQDVLGVTEDAILKELSKILQDNDLEQVASRAKYKQFVNEVIAYLEEERKRLKKQQRKNVSIIMAKQLAKILKKKYPNITKEQAGRMGIHGAIIRYIS